MSTPTKRTGGRPRTLSDTPSSRPSRQSFHGQKKNGKQHIPQSPTHDDVSQSAESDADTEEGNDEDGEEEDEGDEDVFAPSVGPLKRGHQTGLSVSLSNTSLGKRGRSPDSSENEERPTSKMSKTDGDGETSDDDAYNAVDDISGSEEEGEGDVEQTEERAIINSEEEDNTSEPGARGSFSSVGSVFGNGFDIGSDFLFGPQPTFFDDSLADVLRNNARDVDPEGVPVRRVRFAEEVTKRPASSSSSSATESEDEAQIYPDLFVQQSSLDPAFRKLVEKNNDGSGSDGEGSYWDFENDNRVEELDDDDESDSSLSGYETDEGETTDEDFNVPLTIQPNKGLMRSDDPQRNRTKNRNVQMAPPMRKAGAVRRLPTLGSFTVDQSKDLAVIDHKAKNMLVWKAQRKSRTIEGGRSRADSTGSFSQQGPSESESDIGFTPVDPMLSSPANNVVPNFHSSRTNRVGSGLSNEILGPEEAFFPFVTMNNDGTFGGDDNDVFDDDFFSDADLNIEDFINFGEVSSDEEQNEASQEQGEDPSSNSTAAEDDDREKTPQPTPKFTAVKPRIPSTPVQPSSDSLLHHFDRNVASSFRRNAERHKSWMRSPITAGIKGGRFEIANNNTISPMRRRKGMPATPSSQLQSMGPPSTPASASRSGGQNVNGPLKKRIHSSEKVQKMIQRYAARKRKNDF